MPDIKVTRKDCVGHFCIGVPIDLSDSPLTYVTWEFLCTYHYCLATAKLEEYVNNDYLIALTENTLGDLVEYFDVSHREFNYFWSNLTSSHERMYYRFANLS